MGSLTNAQIIERAEKFFERVYATCSEIHKLYHADIEFGLIGKQWDPDAEKQRAGRLTLTVNRLRQFIYQVVNDYKKSEMTSKVLPHDTSEKDKKQAEIRRGIMRSLERKKGGLTAYNNAAKTLVAGGLGGWRIVTDYISPESVDEQEPKFIPIEDMGTVWVDFEDCREPDLADMMDCLITEQYTKERFKSKFKKDPNDFLGSFENPTVWGNKEGPVVSDYWFKEESEDTTCKLAPIAGQLIPELAKKKSAFKSDLEKLAGKYGVDVDLLIATDEAGNPITRETTRCKVRCAKLAGKEIVEVQDWPIDLIPVAIAIGRKTVNKGEIVIEGLTRQAKDAQKSYNYAKSNKTERMAQIPKVPWMVPTGGIPKNRKRDWAGEGNPSYLEYNIYDEQGRPIPAPQRPQPVGIEPGLVEEEQQSVDEIKAAIGMYDASVGNRSNETSGRAIQARAQEADTTNYDFTESMITAIKYSTKVLNRLIPKVIDTARQVTMVGEDDKETTIMVNQDNPGGESYYLDDSEFDIDYEAGPSSATKGQDIRDNLTAIFQAVPGTVLPLGSEYIRNSEMRNADQAADRFERWANTQSPGLYEEKNQGAPNPQMIAQMQAQMQQMQQALQQMQPQMEQLAQENQRLKIENQAIKADKTLDAERVKIEWFKAKTDADKKGADVSAKQSDLALKADQQQHDQLIDKAELVHSVHQDHQAGAMQHEQHAHAMNKDNATMAMAAERQGHDMSQDRERLALEKSKPKDAGSTGGKPGNKPKPGVNGRNA